MPNWIVGATTVFHTMATVGAPRSGRDRTAGRHASAAVCKYASVLEWNEKKSKDGRRTGPYKGRKLAT